MPKTLIGCSPTQNPEFPRVSPRLQTWDGVGRLVNEKKYKKAEKHKEKH